MPMIDNDRVHLLSAPPSDRTPDPIGVAGRDAPIRPNRFASLSSMLHLGALGRTLLQFCMTDDVLTASEWAATPTDLANGKPEGKLARLGQLWKRNRVLAQFRRAAALGLRHEMAAGGRS